MDANLSAYLVRRFANLQRYQQRDGRCDLGAGRHDEKTAVFAPSHLLTVKDCQQIVERMLDPTEVADVAPMNGIGVVAEMVVGELLEAGQFDGYCRSADQVGVDGSGLAFHREAYRSINGTSFMLCSIRMPSENRPIFRKILLVLAPLLICSLTMQCAQLEYSA